MLLQAKDLLKPVKSLRKLIAKIDAHASPEDVHDLRTNTRRVEAIFDALSLREKDVGKAFCKDLRSLRKRAGKVREMDVLSLNAATIPCKEDAECAMQLLEHLGAERQKHARKLSTKVSQVGQECRKRLDHVANVLESLPVEQAAASAAAASARLARAVGEPQTFTKDNLHAYRLGIKNLRNVLRLAGARTAKDVEVLGTAKDAIGEWHDWQGLVTIAKKVLKDDGRQLQSQLKQTCRRKFYQARSVARKLRITYAQKSRQLKNDR